MSSQIQDDADNLAFLPSSESHDLEEAPAVTAVAPLLRVPGALETGSHSTSDPVSGSCVKDKYIVPDRDGTLQLEHITPHQPAPANVVRCYSGPAKKRAVAVAPVSEGCVKARHMFPDRDSTGQFERIIIPPFSEVNSACILPEVKIEDEFESTSGEFEKGFNSADENRIFLRLKGKV